MRTLAIDYGSKRIGIALSDEAGKLATPYDVLTSNAIEKILSLIKKEDVKRIVVGLPLNMDGSIGPAARNTIAWAKQLGASVIFVDERLSSFAAEQTLIERKRAGEKLTRNKKNQQLDALAAAGFLQAFLDGKLMPLRI